MRAADCIIWQEVPVGVKGGMAGDNGSEKIKLDFPRREGRSKPEVSLKGTPRFLQELPSSSCLLRGSFAKRASSVVAPDALSQPHSHLRGTKQGITAREPADEEGLRLPSFEKSTTMLPLHVPSSSTGCLPVLPPASFHRGSQREQLYESQSVHLWRSTVLSVSGQRSCLLSSGS